jgi:hypothetical protein
MIHTCRNTSLTENRIIQNHTGYVGKLRMANCSLFSKMIVVKFMGPGLVLCISVSFCTSCDL